jgi:catechol 2,3-dioxygenase-like lactoylglutathione lyase family enzyme
MMETADEERGGSVAVQHIAHVGICVSDLERSRSFYRDALGFREVAQLESSGGPTQRLLQVPDAAVRAIFLERDGLRIELLSFVAPELVGDRAPRPMNRRGLTHLALRVNELSLVADTLRRAGGTLLEDTAVENPEFGARAMIVLDPDGTRLELIEAPGDPSVAMGAPVD